MPRTHPRNAPLLAMLALITALSSAVSTADAPAPAFDFERLLNTKTFWNRGAFMLGDQMMGFAPESSTTEILLFNDKREIVQRQTAFDGYQGGRVGAWGTVRTRPEQFELSEPGIYQLLFMVDGKPATRFPFRLVQTSAGDDPFNPDKKYAFDGYWKRLATLRLRPYDFKRTGVWPVSTVWTGELDLPAGQTKDGFEADLFLHDKKVAQANRRVGFISVGHYKPDEVKLLHLHEPGKTANAPPYLLQDYSDGDYQLRLTRHSDRAVFRNYRFTVKDGKIQHNKRSTLGYDPAIDYLMPRGHEFGSQIRTDMEEIFWLFSPPDA